MRGAAVSERTAREGAVREGVVVEGAADAAAADAAGPRAPSRREQAASLGATRRRLFLVGTAASVAAPYLLWASGASDVLWRLLAPSRPTLVMAAVQVAVLTLVLLLVSAPLGFYGGYVVGHRYGLSRQSVAGWLADWAKSAALGTILTTAAGVVFYAAVWWAPSLWWVLFWLAAFSAAVALTFVAPYVIVPLFFRPRPLDDPGLERLIQELVRRAGTTVAGISRLDFSRRTNEANAAVIGFGHSRRVVLADTLLESFTPSEIQAVVAHELGHHVHRDVARLLVLQAGLMLAGLALAAAIAEPVLRALGAGPLGSPGSYPLLVLGAGLFGLLTMPLVNACSRAAEAQADTFAFELLGDGRPFAAAMRRLADQNLAEEWPPRWAVLLLASHPPIGARIRRAEGVHHA